MPSFMGDGLVALISGFDDEGASGGMFAYDGRKVDQLDELPCTGLGVQDGMLARVLRRPEAVSRAALLLHDSDGDVTDVAVDDLVDPHDILWTGDAYAIACAGANKIVFVSPGGEVNRVWEAPGVGDAWHLNGLLLVDGELHVSAFGKYERHRGWNEPDADPAAGLVLNLATGRDVVTGLSSPHHPRLVDDEWIVCNSGRRALTRIDAESGSVEAEIVLDGWTRGLAVLDGFLLVGESPPHRAERRLGRAWQWSTPGRGRSSTALAFPRVRSTTSCLDRPSSPGPFDARARESPPPANAPAPDARSLAHLADGTKRNATWAPSCLVSAKP